MDGGGFDRAEENMQKRADRDARLIRQHSRLEFQKDDSVPSVCLSLFYLPACTFYSCTSASSLHLIIPELLVRNVKFMLNISDKKKKKITVGTLT